MALINDNFERSDMGVVMEQYKLYVEMADRISQRRMNANTFFISVNTLLFTITSFAANADPFRKTCICILGIVISFAWFFTLNSYKQLNSKKYQVIHEIEALLPISGYVYEWELLKKGESRRSYWPLSHLERIVPIIFFAAYMLMAIFVCSRYGL